MTARWPFVALLALVTFVAGANREHDRHRLSRETGFAEGYGAGRADEARALLRLEPYLDRAQDGTRLVYYGVCSEPLPESVRLP